MTQRIEPKPEVNGYGSRAADRCEFCNPNVARYKREAFGFFYAATCHHTYHHTKESTMKKNTSSILGVAAFLVLLALPSACQADSMRSTLCASGLNNIDKQVDVYLKNPVPQNALYINIALDSYPEGCPKYKADVSNQIARLTAQADEALNKFASAPSKDSVSAVIAAVSQLKPFDTLAVYDNQVEKVKLALASFTGRELAAEQVELLNPSSLPSGDRMVLAAFKESYSLASARKINVKIDIASNQDKALQLQS